MLDRQLTICTTIAYINLRVNSALQIRTLDLEIEDNSNASLTGTCNPGITILGDLRGL